MKKYNYVLILICFITSIFIGCNKQDNSPEKIVEKYLKCSTWQERLDYVRNVENIDSKMEEHYGDIKLEPLKGSLKYEKFEYGDMVQIITEVSGSPAMYFLLQEDGEYKIDWEASMLKCDMSWAEFKASKPKESTKFRAIVALDDYYNYEFRNLSDSYWSIYLSEITTERITFSRPLSLYGYIPKESEDGKKLFELLKDGSEKAVILELKYPNNNDNSSNCVLITRLVSDSIIEY